MTADQPSPVGPATLLVALALTLAAPPAEAHPGQRCIGPIRAAERNHELPAGLLMAVALTETGRRVGDALTPWPWSINAAGQGEWLERRSSAIARARALQAAGIESIDVGCMQINLKWHEGAFDSLEAAFDPRTNVAYAARHLKALRAGARDWLEAAGRYHSADPARARAYLTRLRRNWQVVREELGTARALLPPAPGRIAPGLGWVASDGLGPLIDLAAPRPAPLLEAGRRGPLPGSRLAAP